MGSHLYAFDEAGDEEPDRVDGHLFGFWMRGRCGCLLLLFDGHAGGHHAVVGGESGGEFQESFGADDGGFEVNAVDGEEVGVEVGAVVDDPAVSVDPPYEAGEAFPAASSSPFMWSKNSLLTSFTTASKFSCVIRLAS